MEMCKLKTFRPLKFLSIFLTLILICSIISGCLSNPLKGNDKKPETPSESQTEKPTVSEEDMFLTQELFNEFLDGLFEELITESTFSLRLRLKNPEIYGITDTEVKIDSFSETYFEDYKEKCNGWINSMTAFDYTHLTEEQQYTYDILLGTWQNDLLLAENSIFYEPMSPVSGIQNQLPVLFSELPIEDEADVTECIKLLNTIPDFFEILVDFQYKKGKSGCFMSENAYKEVTKQCTELAKKDGFGFLCDHFTEKINGVQGLDADKKDRYIQEITKAVTDNFIIGYTYLVDELAIIDATYENNETGLAASTAGRNYYEALVESYTGSGRTIDELIKMTELAIEDDLNNMQSVIASDPESLDKLDDYTMPYEGNPTGALKHLLRKIEDVFPKAPVTEFNVLSVDKALQDMLSPAFYMLPAVDDMNNNSIYINYSEKYADMDLFPTLAHEGYPGHLYQTTYFASKNPHPIRQIICPIGYSEGWAKYAEIYSYNFAGLDKNVATILSIDDIFGFALYSRVDMGIHYEGWNLQDTRRFFSKYNITDSAAISEVYYTLLDNPGIYLQYYIGYLEIIQMRDFAEASLGKDFSLMGFHRFILDCGPSQFYLIRERFEGWLNK